MPSRPRTGRRGPATARVRAAGWRTPRRRSPSARRHATLRGGGRREQRRALELGRDGVELGRPPRVAALEVAAGHGDLHPRGQQLGAREPVPGLRPRARRSMIALAASTRPCASRSERQTGLRATAERLGLAERLLGARRGRRRGGGPPRARRKPAAACTRLIPTSSAQAADRPPPRRGSTRPRDCRAHARWTRHTPGKTRERMALGPPGRRVGPLGRPPEVAELLARADQAAVHLAGRVRTEPALDGGEHGLVEVARAPRCGSALVDQHASERSAGPRPRGRGCAAGVRARSSPCACTVATSSSPRPCMTSTSRRTRLPYSAHSALAVEALTSPPQPRAADARLRPEAVVLVEPDGALPGPPVVARSSS